MAKVSSVLLAVDDSRASTRATDFVAHTMAGRPGVRIVVGHVTAPLPPEYLESPGAEDPAEEERVEARLRTRQRGARERLARRAAPTLTRAVARLRRAGVTSLETAASRPPVQISPIASSSSPRPGAAPPSWWGGRHARPGRQSRPPTSARTSSARVAGSPSAWSAEPASGSAPGVSGFLLPYFGAPDYGPPLTEKPMQLRIL